MVPSAENVTDIRARLTSLIADRSVVLMGVGNELRGDDAFEVILSEHIEQAGAELLPPQ